jgi:hypothetical protein
MPGVGEEREEYPRCEKSGLIILELINRGGPPRVARALASLCIVSGGA